MTSLHRFTSIVCSALALTLVISCGDDDEDNPAAPSSLCDEENTTCLSLTMDADAATYESTYLSGLGSTMHSLDFDVSGRVLSDYAPGQRVHVEVTFSPPLRVRYDNSGQLFELSAGMPPACYDRRAFPNETFEHTGWTEIEHEVACHGTCAAGESSVGWTAAFGPLVTGTELSRVEFDFVVPETYTEGTAQGSPVLPADLALYHLLVYGSIEGNNPGDPPVWPGEYTP